MEEPDSERCVASEGRSTRNALFLMFLVPFSDIHLDCGMKLFKEQLTCNLSHFTVDTMP
jgi:hypothetical protein